MLAKLASWSKCIAELARASGATTAGFDEVSKS